MYFVAKLRTYRHLNLILALWLVITSSGLFIDFHYCEGQLSNLALFEKADSCHESSNNLCESSQSINVCCADENEVSNCCENELKIFKIADDFSKTVQLDLNEVTDISCISEVQEIEVHMHKDQIALQNYIPPPIEKDFQILFQTFLL